MSISNFTFLLIYYTKTNHCMSISDAIVKDLREGHLPLIPRGAMDLLESMPLDSVFVGSVLVAKSLVPTLFLKLAAKTASKAGLVRDSHFALSYKFLTVEDREGNTVSIVTLQQDRDSIMHALLDPADQQVREFLRLAKRQECFFIDVTVADKVEPYGSCDLYDIDGEHLEWVTRNLVRSANVKHSSDWSVAAMAYQSNVGISSRDIFLPFSGAGKHQLHAADSSEFITRGDTDYEPDLDMTVMAAAYRLDWLATQYGINLTDAPTLPIGSELSAELAKLEPGSTSPIQIKKLELLRKQYPAEAVILFPLLFIYTNIGDEVGKNRVLRELTSLAQEQVYIALTLLKLLPDEEFLAAFSKEWPQQELTDHPTRGGHPFTVLEFELFEELAIRAAVLKGHAEDAIKRFVRLVEFGSSGQLPDSLANQIASSLLFSQLDRNPVLPEKLPSSIRAVKYPAARKLLTDSFWGTVEVLRTRMDIKARVKAPASGVRSRLRPRIGRNTPCPCGSGKKYKHCCGG